MSVCQHWLARMLVLLATGVSCRPAPASKSVQAQKTSAPATSRETLPTTEPEIPPPPPPLSLDEVPHVGALARPLPELAAFYDQLDAVRHGHQALRPVRVMWMGDSHTSADFMTHRVRLRLQTLASDAGPGFLRLGLDAYRHEGASFEVFGKWRQEPVLPAQRTRVKDGVFGYGGIRTLPQAGARVRFSVRPSAASAAGQLGEGVAPVPLRFRLAYRLPSGAAFDVRVGQEEVSLTSSSAPEADAAAIALLDLSGTMADSFELVHVAGAPEIFGVFVERAEAGLVLDTVGIDGARAATALAWEPEQFVAAVRERAPSLLVLAYGTNEVFDKGAVDQYTEHLVTLIQRVRQGAGRIPCWVIGPMDAPVPGGASRPRVEEVSRAQQAAARREGCAFTSAQALMGGEGSFARWTAARPQLARTDGIHLTIAGYRVLGDLLADTLVPLPTSAERP